MPGKDSLFPVLRNHIRTIYEWFRPVIHVDGDTFYAEKCPCCPLRPGDLRGDDLHDDFVGDVIKESLDVSIQDPTISLGVQFVHGFDCHVAISTFFKAE